MSRWGQVRKWNTFQPHRYLNCILSTAGGLFGDQDFRWSFFLKEKKQKHDLWHMSPQLAQRHSGAEHLGAHWGDFNLSSNDRGTSTVVCYHLFNPLWLKLILWLSVWWTDLLTEQSMTGWVASHELQETASVILTQQNKVKFAFNMKSIIWRELFLSPWWSSVSDLVCQHCL